MTPWPSSTSGGSSGDFSPPRIRWRKAAALAALSFSSVTTIPAAATERVLLREGCELREEPHGDSAVVGVLSHGRYPAIAISDGWLQVIAADRMGWTRCGAQSEGVVEGELGSAPAGPLPATLAKSPFGESGTRFEAGSFIIETDVTGERWRSFFERLAGSVERSYARRYELGIPALPPGAFRDRVVIFSRRSDYRAYASSRGDLANAESAGHAIEGLAVLYTGGRDRSEVGATMVHELTHLLNRRVFPRRIAPWLDEGLAEDLAMQMLDDRGQLDRASRGGPTVFLGERLEILGNLSLLPRLLRRLEDGSLPPMAELMALGHESFEASGDRSLFYLLYGCWPLYLTSLAVEDQTAFRGFLAAAAGGGPNAFEDLIRALGREPKDVEKKFRVWLRRLGERLRIPAEEGVTAGSG